MQTISSYIEMSGLSVHPKLLAFVESEVLPSAKIEPAEFWRSLAAIVSKLSPRHNELLSVRDDMQKRLDDYHKKNPGDSLDFAKYEQFLRDINYLVPAPSAESFLVATKNVDAEIGTMCGPQMIAALSDPTQVVNAVNARWGSLRDALHVAYPDIMASTAINDAGQPIGRIASIRDRMWACLDQIAPLTSGSHADASRYSIEHGALEVEQKNGLHVGLRDPRKMVGFTGPRHAPESVLLINNGLHVELLINRTYEPDQDGSELHSDIVLESALSVIMDMEDSVAVADIDDKIDLYRRWLGLMSGSCSVGAVDNGRPVSLKLADDRIFTSPGGGKLVLPGRALMLVSTVGPHFLTDAIQDAAGNPIPEAIIDTVIAVACAVQDVRGERPFGNSRTGSVYLVKSKIHGPDEVGLIDMLFKHVEEMFELPKYSIKIGLMDEERRTSINLAACLSKVRDRTVFINTGSFDRIADEICSTMESGPMPLRADIRAATWYQAYEDNNVDVGLARNLPGRAQIGKGLWVEAAAMDEFVMHRASVPASGASTSLVSTPAAAVLHARHFHTIDVRAVQDRLRTREPGEIGAHLTPMRMAAGIPADAVVSELQNTLGSVLGYVVNWVDKGIGQSLVADADGVSRVENAATLRLNCLHIANWLRHNLVCEADVRSALQRAAEAIDSQNGSTNGYVAMSPDFNGLAYKAAEDLVLNVRKNSNGYTGPVLSEWRRKAKRAARHPAASNASEAEVMASR